MGTVAEIASPVLVREKHGRHAPRTIAEQPSTSSVSVLVTAVHRPHDNAKATEKGIKAGQE